METYINKINELEILIESVQRKLAYEVLNESVAEEEKDSKIKAGTKIIINAVKKLFVILRNVAIQCYAHIESAFKKLGKSEFVVVKKTDVIDIKVDSILTEKHNPDEYVMYKIYKVGEKVNKAKILKEIAMIKITIDKAIRQLDSMDETDKASSAEANRLKTCCKYLEDSLLTHKELIANTDWKKQESKEPLNETSYTDKPYGDIWALYADGKNIGYFKTPREREKLIDIYEAKMNK